MAIVPDSKDWTWVLERPCPQCGLDAGRVDPTTVGSMTRTVAASWADVLAESDVGRRPTADVWSPLEYACHVRDVFDLFDHRLALMLTQPDPLFPNWDQDATAVEHRYGDQDAPVVSSELAAAAHRVAGRFDGVAGEAWARTGRRSDGASFTVESFARYFIHDPVHHLFDVTGVPADGRRSRSG